MYTLAGSKFSLPISVGQYESDFPTDSWGRRYIQKLDFTSNIQNYFEI